MTASFGQFGLHSNIEAALAKAGLTVPTPVQEQAIPAAMAGSDIMASAQTGTGKTAAFVLPALHRILSTPAAKGRGPRLLVLTPTRELAQQVQKNVQQFGMGSQLKTSVIVGGVAYGPQYSQLQGNLDVMVATPGRLIDHLDEKRVDFSRVEMVVLDEADRMLDMGFLNPVNRILKAIDDVTTRPQILLFSATFTPSVDKFAKTALTQPKRMELAPAKSEHSQIEQKAYRSDGGMHKQDLLKATLEGIGGGQAIIFAATKHGSEKLAKTISVWGYQSEALHGGMRQNVRTRTLKKMHENKIQFLVATDVAARGIDVKLLSHVINYDLPQVAEDYVHRIGRTGRAGDTGIAISLIAPTDYPMMKEIEKVLGKPIPLAIFEGHAPSLDAGEFERQGKLAPKSRGGNKRQNTGFGQKKTDGQKRAYSRAGEGEARAAFSGRGKSYDRTERNAGERSWSKPTGERSFSGPRTERAEGGERKSWGNKSASTERSERPYAPRADRGERSERPYTPRTERANGEGKSWSKPSGERTERSGYAGKPASGGYKGNAGGGYKGNNAGGYKGKSSFGGERSSAPRGEGRSEGAARPARIGGGFKGRAAAGGQRSAPRSR